VYEILPTDTREQEFGVPMVSGIEDEKAVEAVAKALFEHALQQARAEVDKIGVGIIDAKQFFLELRKETDAALVVLSTSYVDTHLTDAFKKNMPNLSENESTYIFDSAGPFSTMSGKIRVAHALGWLSDETSEDLHLLRKIRNLFAHDPYKRKIDASEIADYVATLHKYEIAPLDAIKQTHLLPALTTRQLYHIRAAMTCFRMTIEMLVIAVTSNPNLTLMLRNMVTYRYKQDGCHNRHFLKRN